MEEGYTQRVVDLLWHGRRPEGAGADLAVEIRDRAACTTCTCCGKRIKLAAAIRHARPHLFVFMTRRGVEPTNNASEQRLRGSVIFRKVTNGFRSGWGARVYADTCSIIATGRLSGRRLPAPA